MQTQLLRECIQWDVKSWSKALLYWEQHIPWHQVDRCLELGSREGGLSLWLALKGKEVICSDVGDVKQTAGALHRRYGVADKIHYESIDATYIPYENQFDLIVFKSILGVVGKDGNARRQQQAIHQIKKALKPGGKLVFAENLTGSPLHCLLRRRFVKWGRSWRYVSLNEIESYLQVFKSYTLKSNGFSSAFGRTEAQRNGLAAIDDALLNYCVPDRWKYIVYGMAEK